MSRSKIRWGILGAGGIARRFAGDIGQSETGVLVAVGSRSMQKAQDFARSFGQLRAFDEYAALTGWDGVDAIYVATPSALHKAHCLLAIGAGKAVLCEKPFARNAAEAQEVADAALAANVFCKEAMWTRFLPALGQLRDRIAAGQLGRIAHLNITLGFARHEKPGDPITDPALGGGALLDLGVYGVSIAEDLLGPCHLAGSDIVTSESGSVRTAALLLRHERDGEAALSNIAVSHATQLPNTLVVSGDKGRATLEAPFIAAQRGRIASVAWADPAAIDSGLKSRLTQSPLWPLLRRARRAIRPTEGQSFGGTFPGTGMQFQIDAVGRHLAAGEITSSRMPLTSTIEVLRILEAAAHPASR